MTPDDAPIPAFDRIARAARQGLGDLARSAAPGELSWDTVQSGVRRVHRRRFTAIGAAVALVLLSSGIAVAATGGNGDRVRVGGGGTPPTTTATTTTPTTAVELPTTTTTPDTTPGIDGAPTTTTPAVAPPLAGAADLQGTISIQSTLVAEEATPLTLTVRNVSDHAVSLEDGWPDILGVAIEGNYLATGGGGTNDHSTLAAGEQVSFDQTITPWDEAVGPARISAAILRSSFMTRLTGVLYRLPGVPSVPITVIPPGTVPGEPLDASLGQWGAELTTDSTTVAAGDPVVVHLDLTNVGDQPQNTGGFGAVVVACGDHQYSSADTQVVGASTVAPGATISIPFSFEPAPWEITAGTLVCWAGVAIHGNATDIVPRQGFETNTLHITIVPAGTTTTTVPETTTTTTP